MADGFNLDEYVSEMLAISEGRPSARDLAESIADITMAQGHYEGRKFEDVVAELTVEVEYYL